MSNIKEEADGLNTCDIETINKKRIVFIIDECHRSTFGDMLITIKNTFPKAMFFGFTGTPIHEKNEKQKNTTATVLEMSFIDIVLQMESEIRMCLDLIHIKY